MWFTQRNAEGQPAFCTAQKTSSHASFGRMSWKEGFGGIIRQIKEKIFFD